MFHNRKKELNLERIYVDHAATSPVHPAVLTKMMNVMSEQFGNPSSIHSFGRNARYEIDKARAICAKSIQANRNEIIFTSGGTESDNLAIRGIAYANRDKGNHIITTTIEHHAVLNTCKQLEKEGFLVTYLPVDNEGRISISSLEEALTDNTILVSIMFGNNEVGTLQPLKEIGELISNHQAYLHTDAVQVYGTVEIDVNDLSIDAMSVSSHKINGPKGVGFLYLKDGTKFHSTITGGEQERKRRAGTENVAGVVGFAEAITILKQELHDKTKLYEEYQTVILSILEENHIEFVVNTPKQNHVPHILNISFVGIDVESFLVQLDMNGIAASSGSACTAGSFLPSHVLVAMFGSDSSKVRSSIRISFGLGNSKEQMEQMANRIVGILNK